MKARHERHQHNIHAILEIGTTSAMEMIGSMPPKLLTETAHETAGRGEAEVRTKSFVPALQEGSGSKRRPS
jgi:hypothetical protein